MLHARIARFDVMATVALFGKTFWNWTSPERTFSVALPQSATRVEWTRRHTYSNDQDWCDASCCRHTGIGVSRPTLRRDESDKLTCRCPDCLTVCMSSLASLSSVSLPGAQARPESGFGFGVTFGVVASSDAKVFLKQIETEWARYWLAVAIIQLLYCFSVTTETLERTFAAMAMCGPCRLWCVLVSTRPRDVVRSAHSSNSYGLLVSPAKVSYVYTSAPSIKYRLFIKLNAQFATNLRDKSFKLN